MYMQYIIPGYIRHDNIRDLTARLLTEVCPNVTVEPELQPLTGETLSHRTSNYEDGAHLDVSEQGFWGDRHDRAFFDVHARLHMQDTKFIDQ